MLVSTGQRSWRKDKQADEKERNNETAMRLPRVYYTGS
jgi:hypothetical protein